MSANHTPGPWIVVDIGTRRGERFEIQVAQLGGGIRIGMTEGNARRIVACVNACEGISNAGLEKPTLFGAVGAERDRMRMERDQARSARDMQENSKRALEIERAQLRVSLSALLHAIETPGDFTPDELLAVRTDAASVLAG